MALSVCPSAIVPVSKCFLLWVLMFWYETESHDENFSSVIFRNCIAKAKFRTTGDVKRQEIHLSFQVDVHWQLRSANSVFAAAISAYCTSATCQDVIFLRVLINTSELSFHFCSIQLGLWPTFDIQNTMHLIAVVIEHKRSQADCLQKTVIRRQTTLSVL